MIAFGRTALVAATVMVLAAMPAVGQETILGFFEGPLNGENAGTGAIPVTGWALATSGVRSVTIQVNGVDIGEALYGQNRPLVEDDFPGFVDSPRAGFGYQLNSTDFPNGVHNVSAKVETFDGNQQVLWAIDPEGVIHMDGIREVLFTNNTNILVPFGRINFPERNVDLGGTCSNTSVNRRFSVISGWALDLGVEIGDAGVGWVELLVDGVIVANTRTSCTFNQNTGGLSNCYGLPRLDIERNFPFALDAPSAGYRFVLDVGNLINNGWVQGRHTLTIRVGDLSNQHADIDEIPVNFLCIENLGNEPSFGQIEVPRPGQAYDELLTFQGWALDADSSILGSGVQAVELFVDGESIGFANFGLPGITRPFVLSNYPGYPNALNPVWRLTDFDTTTLTEGVHQVQVFVYDWTQTIGSTDLGDEPTLIGETSFFVNNEVD